jgi:hypothetical protein
MQRVAIMCTGLPSQWDPGTANQFGVNLWLFPPNEDLADVYAYLQAIPKGPDAKSIPLLNQ